MTKWKSKLEGCVCCVISINCVKYFQFSFTVWKWFQREVDISTSWLKTQWACWSSRPFYWRPPAPPPHVRSQAGCCCCPPDSDWTTWKKSSDRSLVPETPDTRAGSQNTLLNTAEEQECVWKQVMLVYLHVWQHFPNRNHSWTRQE